MPERCAATSRPDNPGLVAAKATAARSPRHRRRPPRGKNRMTNLTGSAARAPLLAPETPSGALLRPGGPDHRPGRMNQKVLPFPKIDSHPMVPPWSSTNLRQSASPSPVPWARRLAELSTWLNSTNSLDMSWGRTPTPSSLTATQTASRVVMPGRSSARSDGHRQRRAGTEGRDGDVALVGRELGRVGEQVEEHLAHPLAVGEDGERPLFHVHVHGLPLRRPQARRVRNGRR